MGNTGPDQQIAREYLRVSVDRSGRERSNDEQHEDNQRAADNERWTLGEPYRDTGSASRYASKRRKDFDALVADLRADQPDVPSGSRFAAHVLLLWESSRGSRRLSEWATFLELVEERGVRIHVTSHGRTYDLTNPRDRRTLQEDGTDAEYESGKTSVRVKRGAARGAAAGRPHGRRLFGYRRVYDRDTGALRGQEPDPEQAPVIRRVFADYLSGKGPRTIADELNAEGVTTNAGRRWNNTMIFRIIDNPAYIGKRRHHGTETPAVWPPIIDEDTWARARTRRDQARWKRPKVTSHLLSGILVCGKCGARMEVHYGGKSVFYGCERGYHAYRPLERTDGWVTHAYLNRLRQPDAQAALTSTTPTVDQAAARAEVTHLRSELDAALEAWRRKELSVTAYSVMERDLTTQIVAAEKRAEVRRPGISLDNLPEDLDALEAWWDAKTTEQQRAHVSAAVEVIRAHPIGRGRRKYRMGDYTEIEWR